MRIASIITPILALLIISVPINAQEEFLTIAYDPVFSSETPIVLSYAIDRFLVSGDRNSFFSFVDLSSENNLKLSISNPLPNLLEDVSLEPFSIELSSEEVMAPNPTDPSSTGYFLLQNLIQPTVAIYANETQIDGFDILNYHMLPILSNVGIRMGGIDNWQTDVKTMYNFEGSLLGLEVYNATQYQFWSITNFGLITQYIEITDFGNGYASMQFKLTSAENIQMEPYFYDIFANYSQFFLAQEEFFGETEYLEYISITDPVDFDEDVNTNTIEDTTIEDVLNGSEINNGGEDAAVDFWQELPSPGLFLIMPTLVILVIVRRSYGS